jgi:2'-5' RNA ligase
MTATFILLEMLDPDVNSLLWDIREALHGSRSPRPIHLTLRGPYEGPVPEGALKQCRRALKQDVIRVSGVGQFTNPDEEVVYLRVDSPHLREVWWKPDFPIERYGFEPHVSVYRGPDSLLARRAAEFLKHERIDLLCAEHRVVSHPQLDLFQNQPARSSIPSRLVESLQIDPTLITRLRELVTEHDRAREEQIR